MCCAFLGLTSYHRNLELPHCHSSLEEHFVDIMLYSEMFFLKLDLKMLL